VLGLLALSRWPPEAPRELVWLDGLTLVAGRWRCMDCMPRANQLMANRPRLLKLRGEPHDRRTRRFQRLLWVVVLALLVVVFALARQVGILYERMAPMGALMIDSGPKVGEAAPRFDLPALDGGELAVGAASAHSQLLFFLSPTCPVCKKLLPILKSIAAAEGGLAANSCFASDGEPDEHRGLPSAVPR
jgi:hypothetical protein